MNVILKVNPSADLSSMNRKMGYKMQIYGISDLKKPINKSNPQLTANLSIKAEYIYKG